MGHALIAGEQVAEGLSRISKLKKVAKGLGKVLGAYAPFLGGISAMVSIVGLYGDSPELQKLNQVIDLLNDGFTRMEIRFDELGGKINDLNRDLKEESFWLMVRPDLKALDSVHERINDYLGVSDPKTRKDLAANLNEAQWDKQYDALNALEKGFNGEFFPGGFCRKVTEFKNADRREVVRILVKLYSWMLRGAMIDFYKHYPGAFRCFIEGTKIHSSFNTNCKYNKRL